MTSSGETKTIICKPTMWYVWRAMARLVMFLVFAVLFYKDGSTGYRKKNEEYSLHRAFQKASAKFQQMQDEGTLTPEAWRAVAEKQTVPSVEADSKDDPKIERSTLPAGVKFPIPWPEILRDYEKAKLLQRGNALWLEYSKERGFSSKPEHKPFTADEIRNQWVVFWISSGLALLSMFFMIRALSRKVQADEEGIAVLPGKKVLYGDLKVLDLRKWDRKGVAFLDYDGVSGKGRMRIDGFIYGGFKKEKGEPAEKLMQFVRSRFSGEILEYTPENEADEVK